MKYIKIFENFLTTSEIESIFWDLKDNGFTIDIHDFKNIDQYLIGIKKFEGYLRPFLIDSEIISSILTLESFAEEQGFKISNISINHPYHKQSSRDVTISDGAFFVKSVYGPPFQPERVKVEDKVMWISIKLEKM